MTRAEYNEYRYIKSTVKKFGYPSYGCTCTIPTNASADYKRRLDALYTSWNMHPGGIRVDPHMYDNRERIIYIYGRTWEMNGDTHDWSELYTKEELIRFVDALN